MGKKHKCDLDQQEKTDVLEKLKCLLEHISLKSGKQQLSSGPPAIVPLHMIKRLPRFQRNYDLIPIVTYTPILEIRPTSNSVVYRHEGDNPNVAYIKIEPNGNPFKTDWDEMRIIRREICPKHDVRYGAHVHEDSRSTLDQQAAYQIPKEIICKGCGKSSPSRLNMSEIPKEQADSICVCVAEPKYNKSFSYPPDEKHYPKKVVTATKCGQCDRHIVSPALLLANLPNLKLDTICMCEALDYLFRKAGLVPKGEWEARKSTVKTTNKYSKADEPPPKREYCYCKPEKGQKVTYVCNCKPPNGYGLQPNKFQPTSSFH